MAFQWRCAEAIRADAPAGDAHESGHAGRITDLAIDHRRIVIAFVGMAFEARIAAGPGVLVFCRNAQRELATAAESASRNGYRGIISFGVAGGLSPVFALVTGWSRPPSWNPKWFVRRTPHGRAGFSTSLAEQATPRSSALITRSPSRR